MKKSINKAMWLISAILLVGLFLSLSGCVTVYRIDNHGGCVINGTDRDDQDFSNACSLMMDSSNNDNTDQPTGLTVEPSLGGTSTSPKPAQIEPEPFQDQS